MRSAPNETGLREYLIEVPHSAEECPPAQQTDGRLDESAHRSYCGCEGGTHTTWIFAELASEAQAWSLVPTLLRDTARVTRLHRCFSDDSLDRAKGGSR